MLGALILIVLGIWIFVEVADEVVEGESLHLDERILQLMRRADNPSDTIGPHWLKVAALDITSLGGPTVLILFTAAAIGYLALQHKTRAMLLVLVAALGGQVMSASLKAYFDRARPVVVPQLAEVQTSSFPSGHSMMSAAVYLTLGALLTQFVEQRRARIYIIALACVLTLTIGASRVFLGVHYPTDVLAGWAAGSAWALVCWVVARVLQQRGRVEQPGIEPELQEEVQRDSRTTS